MKKEDVITCCIGATAAHLVYAATHPNTLILEPGEAPVPELCRTLRPTVAGIARSEAVRELLAVLAENGCISSDGRVDTPALAPAAAAYVAKKHLRLLFRARFVSCETVKDGCVVTYYDVEGLHRLPCKKVLADKPTPAPSYCLRCLASDVTEAQLTALQAAGFTADSGFEAGEVVLSLPVPNAAYGDALRRLQDTWQSVFPHGECQIDVIAQATDTAANCVLADIAQGGDDV